MGNGRAKLTPLIQGLLRPEAYPHPVGPIELIQTHVSTILLAGPYAYKVKKARDLGFLDFRTLAARRHFCEQEVALNRRLCPQLYLGVVPIVGSPAAPSIDGAGEPIEWAVKMRRLAPEQLLTTRLAKRTVTPDEIEAIAERLAAFHATAATGGEIDQFGTPATIRHNTGENFAGLRPFIGQVISDDQFSYLQTYTADFLTSRARLLADRIAGGHIRDCHGDVHAGSISFEQGEVCIFDCIEFNDRFRYSDVAAEIAFLAMDLDHYGRADLAGRLVTAYQRVAGDRTITAELDFYKCYRALVRAKVESLRARQAEVAPGERQTALTTAQEYVDLALTYAGATTRPVLLITVGLMGAGKTTVAAALSRRLALVHLTADAMRKALAGVPAAEHHFEPYGAGIYSAAFSEQTYRGLLAEAATWLRRGQSVIIDASFRARVDRDHARALAGALGLPFLAIECRCSEAETRRRLDQRLTEPGAISDGRWALFRQQQADYQPPTELAADELVVVETDRPLAEGVALVWNRLADLAGQWLRLPLRPLGDTVTQASPTEPNG